MPPGDPHRRAVIVLTDGIDTSSLMKPEQVSALASAIDVPVYVMTVVSPLEHPRGPDAARWMKAEPRSRSLARWTGGELFVTSAPAHESIAARQIVDELRHQYVLAFERVGWGGVASARREGEGSGFDGARTGGYSDGTRRSR